MVFWCRSSWGHVLVNTANLFLQRVLRPTKWIAFFFARRDWGTICEKRKEENRKSNEHLVPRPCTLNNNEQIKLPPKHEDVHLVECSTFDKTSRYLPNLDRSLQMSAEFSPTSLFCKTFLQKFANLVRPQALGGPSPAGTPLTRRWTRGSFSTCAGSRTSTAGRCSSSRRNGASTPSSRSSGRR